MLADLKILLKYYYLIYFRRPRRLIGDIFLAVLIGSSIVLTRLQHLGDIGLMLYVMTLPFTFLTIVRTLVGEIVAEKASGVKEYLKLSGLSSFTYQVYCFIIVFSKTFLYACFIVGGTYLSGVLGQNQSGIFDLLDTKDTLQVYSLCAFATVPVILFLSTIFSESKLASSVSGMIYIGVSLASFIVLSRQDVFYYLMCLFPQSGLTLSLFINLYDDESDYVIDIPTKLFKLKMVLLFDFFFYLILYMYLDQVIKDENGVSKPLLFFLDFLKLKKKNKSGPEGLLADENRSGSGEEDAFIDASSAIYHENIYGLRNKQKAVQVNGLVKRFGELNAVDNVSFSIYEGQVFCLLGHNGAGKTTAIKMLAGILENDGGDILYYGKNLIRNFREVRQKIGICAQNDILFDRLKVHEHLELIARIKKIPVHEISLTVEGILRQMNLDDERNKFSEELSGGNKRKLSLAMAVIGGTKVVFLDEPTSGMDPQNRRVMWNTLKQLKAQGMTILLTTHHLDEADELAERIAIMSRGKLLALGTSEFFKKNFGVGYYLSLTPIYNKISSADFEAQKPQLSRIISQVIPQAKFDDQTASDVVKCSLPFSAQGNFPKLFAEIEKIDGIKISIEMNTLEDVFVNIGLSEDRFFPGHNNNVNVNINIDPPEALSLRPSYSFIAQTSAIAKRRIYILTRSGRDVFMMIIPLLLISIGTVGTFGFSHPSEKVMIFIVMAIFAYALNTAVYCSLPVYEREEKLKYLMDVMGLRNLPYWLGNLTIDLIFLSLMNGIVYLLYSKLYNDLELETLGVFVSPADFLTLTICHGFALINVGYAWSFIFDQALSAVKYFPLIYFFIFNTVANLLITLVNTHLTSQQTRQVLIAVINILCPTSHYLQVFLQTTSGYTTSNQPLYFQLSEVGYGLFYFILTILLESRRLQFKRENNVPAWTAQEPQEIPVDTNEILQEKNRTLQSQNDPIKVENLVKTYDNGYTAVRNSTFGVEEGQIFGLLGPNGAGKSTTFNILTAAVPKSQGSVKLLNTEVDRNIPKVFENVGVCGQFNGLWSYLTVKEHLTLFGNLKGLRGSTLDDVVNYYLDILFLREHANKKAGNLSGGNKRKLGVANAFIGSAFLLFLDEPSTGMDPLARRFLWNSIQQVLKARKASIVLTTHSMYEAESLSHKIGILINGRFVCLGSTQHLKEKYNQGYKVTVTCLPHVPDPSDEILEIFPQAVKFPDSSAIRQTYNIPEDGFRFSEAFEKLNDLKQQGLINDFSIYNTTLEQVFIYFSKFQIDVERNRA